MKIGGGNAAKRAGAALPLYVVSSGNAPVAISAAMAAASVSDLTNKSRAKLLLLNANMPS